MGRLALVAITKEFRKFEVGDNVHVEIDPSIHKGQPHIRFHGLTARVVGMQGRSYMLDVFAGNKKKQIIVRPEHLRKAAK